MSDQGVHDTTSEDEQPPTHQWDLMQIARDSDILPSCPMASPLSSAVTIPKEANKSEDVRTEGRDQQDERVRTIVSETDFVFTYGGETGLEERDLQMQLEINLKEENDGKYRADPRPGMVAIHAWKSPEQTPDPATCLQRPSENRNRFRQRCYHKYHRITGYNSTKPATVNRFRNLWRIWRAYWRNPRRRCAGRFLQPRAREESKGRVTGSTRPAATM